MKNSDQSKEIVIPTANLADPMFGNLRVTKVVCSRSVKTAHGEAYVGMSMTGEPGIDIKQARVAALRLGMEVERLAFQRAILGHALPADTAEPLVAAIVHDYVEAIRAEMVPLQAAAEPPKIEGSNE